MAALARGALRCRAAQLGQVAKFSAVLLSSPSTSRGWRQFAKLWTGLGTRNELDTGGQDIARVFLRLGRLRDRLLGALVEAVALLLTDAHRRLHIDERLHA
jgi:hypothetical protein